MKLLANLWEWKRNLGLEGGEVTDVFIKSYVL